MHYRELFKLCDYSEKEITQESARIEKTFEKAGITPADVDRAVERLNKYFRMESAGVRTIWGIWMKQFIDLALCREEHKKIVYYTYPLIIKKLVEERARVPLLTIECDQMDSRDAPTEVLRTRMETFAEMLEMRKAAKP